MAAVGMSGKGLPFWPALFDDAGLDPFEVRLYLHILRRDSRGRNARGCFASVPQMARACRMAEATARRALAGLRAMGAVTVEERPGKPALVRVVEEWRPERLVSSPVRVRRTKPAKRKATPAPASTTAPAAKVPAPSPAEAKPMIGKLLLGGDGEAVDRRKAELLAGFREQSGLPC